MRITRLALALFVAASAVAPARAQSTAPNAPATAQAPSLTQGQTAPAPAHPAAIAPLVAPAAPAPAPSAAPSTAPDPANPAPAPAPTPPTEPTLAPDGLGAQVVLTISAFFETLTQQVVAGASTVRSLPALWNWAELLVTNPLNRDRLIDTAWRLAILMAAGLAAEFVLGRAVRRPIAALDARSPSGRRDAADPDIAPLRDAEQAADTPPPPLGPTIATADDPLGAPTDEGMGPGRAAPPPRRPSPLTMLRRLPFVAVRLLLDLLPVIAFVTVGHVLAGTDLGLNHLMRLTLLVAVDGYAVFQALGAASRVLLSPAERHLRLITLSDGAAAYLVRWLRRIAVIAVAGYVLAEGGTLFGLSILARDLVLKAFAFALHASVCVMILQCRRPVAAWLRGRADAPGTTAALRRALADRWWIFAVFYVAALWVVKAAQVGGGWSGLFRVALTFAVIGVGARLLLIVVMGSLDRLLRISPEAAARHPGLEARARLYGAPLRASVNALVFVTACLLLLQSWGLDPLGWLYNARLGKQLVSAMVTVALTIAAAAVVWEAVNATLNRQIARMSAAKQVARAARLRTLQPMLRTALGIAIVVVVGLMALSEIGVNTAPLLAGAGVLGIAIGFGSQKLVQDVITGLFLLLENTMQVGDVVSLGGLSGSVEALSIRTIRLRSEDGSVHVIPFSAVTTVTNMTRDFAHAVIVASVAQAHDYDATVTAMEAIVTKMRAEPAWKYRILEDLEVWGLDRFSGNGVEIKVRIKCGAFDRWAVGREYNRRMKARFEALGIESSMPQQQLVMDTVSVRLPHADQVRDMPRREAAE